MKVVTSNNNNVAFPFFPCSCISFLHVALFSGSGYGFSNDNGLLVLFRWMFYHIIYSGAPLIQPAIGQANLAVLTG